MANKFTDAVHKLILPGKGRDRVTTKAVLAAMAWHTDNKSGVFWGSYALFAHEANCSRDAVRESIPKLIELGLLTIIGQKPTRFGPCHMFKMNYDVIVKYSDQVAEVPSGSHTGLEDDQAGEEPSGSATHYQMAEPHHQGVEPSHQVARPLKNSSLNSSFNSSSHDKPYASLRPLRGDHSMEAPSVRPGEPGPCLSTYLANLVEEEQTPSPVNPTPAIEIPPPAPSCRVCRKPLTEGREITRRKCEACHAKAVAEQEKLEAQRAELRRVMATHSWDRAQTCVLCREHQDDIHYGLVEECTGKKSKSMAFDLED